MAMLSPKKLIKMARRWRKFAAMQRRRISFPRNGSNADGCSTSSSYTVEKGHFVVYTIDQRRYAFPLTYLENEVVRQLLSTSKKSLDYQVVALLHYPVIQPSWTTSFH
ncbi:Auxin-responsive protein SAUR64 [Capsicum annuum]|nr:Auxin-responsive protein SAUR64 [Capsicum annuum]